MDNVTPHTPGPWCVEAINSEHLHDICLGYDIPGAGSPILIASTFGDDDRLVSDKTAEANARRIVACVNICEGISTEDLERRHTVSDGVPRIAELVEAAEEAAAYLAMRDRYHGDFGAADKATRLRAAIAAMREMQQP